MGFMVRNIFRFTLRLCDAYICCYGLQSILHIRDDPLRCRPVLDYVVRPQTGELRTPGLLASPNIATVFTGHPSFSVQPYTRSGHVIVDDNRGNIDSDVILAAVDT